MNDICGKNLSSFVADQIEIWFDCFIVKKVEFKTKGCSFPVKVIKGNLNIFIIFNS